MSWKVKVDDQDCERSNLDRFFFKKIEFELNSVLLYWR